MSSEANSSLRPRELGQLFGGWIVGIFIIAAMIIYVADTLRRARNSTESAVYRELALNVAKAGFEDGLSFFRTHPSGCYLNSSLAPTSQSWVTPWPTYPDGAFLPQSTDTEFYSSISLNAGTLGICAGGIIGDISMDQYVTYTGSDEMTGSSLWGRYVIRRQNLQNWSPGPDTATANTDADAAHDISAISAQSPLGSGTRWSIVSRGYLVRLPSPVSSDASSLLATPAAFTSKNLLSAPLAYYNNQPFLLAQARVYGEMSRVNFNLPISAVMVPATPSADVALVVNANGIVNGDTGYAYTLGSATDTITNNGSISSSGLPNGPTETASIGNCFPGQTFGTLTTMANSLGTSGQISGYTSVNDLPVFEGFNTYTGLSFSAQVDQPTFYCINGSVTLNGGGAGTPVLSGVGLCVINGNLTIKALNDSAWDGVLYVTGLVTLDGPTQVTGILVSQTGIVLGNSADLNKTTVDYDSGAISLVQGLLQNFTVDSSSIVATQF
jgi:hypothetical protein